MSDRDNVYHMTEVFEKFNNAPPKTITAMAEKHPGFSEYLLSTSGHEVWELAHSISRFYIERLAQLEDVNRAPSAKFWHNTRVQQLMFYRLLERASSVISVGGIAVGLPQKELVTMISKTCQVSERNVLRVIDDAVDRGFMEKTTWWRDSRVTVCYLSPRSLAEYLDYGITRHFKAAYQAGLPESNQRFDAVLDQMPDRQLNFNFMDHVDT